MTLANPAGPMMLRDEILALAGETKETMAKRVAKTLQRVDEALDAEKITHHTYQGEVVSESVDIDHGTRIAAGDRVLDMVGARVSKSATSQGSTGPTQVFVVIERAEVPQRVRAEVIEAGPVTPQ